MGAYMAEASENQTAGPKKGDSLEALLDMLNGADEQTRVMIATAFAKVQDPRVIEPLARLLFDTSAQVRSLAAHALGAQGDERALWALIDQAHNMEDDALRANCIAALAQMAHPDSFNTVVTALFDLNDAVRANAAIAAGKLRDARALEPLHMLLDDADARVRANTAWALGELAEPASVPALLAAVDAELDANARSGLFLALGTIATPEAAARILAELTDAEATANGRIAALLAAADVVTQGAADPEFVNMVQGSATDLLAHAEDDELRATAAWTLGHLALEGEGRAVAAETLESALTDPYHWVVAYAIESLAILRVPESEAALRSLAARAENDELVALATKAADVVAGTAEMPASPLSAAPGSREPDQQ